jgi:hypothetical protein
VTAAGDTGSGSDNDPYVAVIGTHRGGTSATAGLLVNLGLVGPRPEDLVPPTRTNERGHWESRAVIRCNNRLLLSLGSSGFGPPPVTLRWDQAPEYEVRKVEAQRWYGEAHSASPIMVKDPRMCLTLAFWREAVPACMASIFVLRNPLHVARSIEARNRLPIALGLALWDRYIRSASSGLAGVPTLVVHYDDLVSQPAAGIATIVGFLERLGIHTSAEAQRNESSWFDASLRHQRSEADQYAELACVQLAMFEQLLRRAGVHDAWEPPDDLPEEPLWVQDFIRMRREAEIIRSEYKEFMKSRLFRTASTLKGRTSRK